MSSKGRPYRRMLIDGFDVLIGKGDAENDVLTFDVGAPRDVWLHVAAHSGSHVLVRVPEEGAGPPEPVVRRAAELAAWYSKARSARRVEVHVCRVRDVSKPRGFPPGKVLLRRWHAVRVEPRGPERGCDPGASPLKIQG